jgi:hypothetical protein
VTQRGDTTTSGREWYADGLRFACTQCGNCCTGPTGYVWFTEAEGKALANRLELSEADFYRRFARKLEGHWSLRENKTAHGYDCIFLDRDTVPGKAVCGVYEARPSQCKTWPFWPENVRSPHSWAQTKKVTPCPGMDTGKLVPIEQIRIQRDMTTM